MILAKPTRDAMGRVIAVAAGILAVGGLLAALRHAPSQSETSAAGATYAFAEPVSPASLRSLVVAELDTPQSFLPAASRDGPTVCDTLAKAGFSNSGWGRSRVAQGRWECYATTDVPTGTGPYNVFYMLRGGARQIEEMRVKLTLREAIAGPAMNADVSGLLDALATSAHVEFPPTFLASVRSENWATYVSPGATYSFAREGGDVPKWNLRVAFADPADWERAGAVLRLPVRALLGPRPGGSAGLSNRRPADE